MSKYLGEKYIADLTGTPYENFTQTDWAMEFIERYGQIDGSHHKAWVLDQVARILKGTPVVVFLASWDSGTQEYRIRTDNMSSDYCLWVESMLGDWDEDGECFEYDYTAGIAP